MFVLLHGGNIIVGNLGNGSKPEGYKVPTTSGSHWGSHRSVSPQIQEELGYKLHRLGLLVPPLCFPRVAASQPQSFEVGLGGCTSDIMNVY